MSGKNTSKGALLRAIREGQNMTVQDLADEVGVTAPEVRRWERDWSSPSATVRAGVIDALEMTRPDAERLGWVTARPASWRVRPVRPPRSPGEIILSARRDAGISQVELAASVGVTPSSISNWERDRNAPASRVRPALFRALNMGPEIAQEFRISGDYYWGPGHG